MIKPIEYIVYRVLPLVYDDSLSYLELVSKVCAKCNELVNVTNNISAVIGDMTKYIEDTAKDVITDTLTPEYIQSIITESFLNQWLEDSAIIGVIETDIANLKERATDTETDINTLKGQMQTANNNISGLEGDISNIVTDITEINTALDGKAPLVHSHDVTTEQITGILPWVKGGTNSNNPREVQHNFFQALNGAGQPDFQTIDEYPAGYASGLYRVGVGAFPGLPVGSGGYGVLCIMRAGDYRLHLFLDTYGHLYYAWTGGPGMPLAAGVWHLLQFTSIDPRPAS